MSERSNLMRIDSRKVSQIAVVFAFLALLHLAILVAIHGYSVSAGYNGFSPLAGGGDDGPDHFAAAHYMSVTGEYSLINVGIQTSLWPVFLSQIFLATGVESVLMLKLLAYVAILVCLLFSLNFLRITETDSMHRRLVLLLLVGLYPSLIIYSYISLYRDAWIYMLHTGAVLGALTLFQKVSPVRRIAAWIGMILALAFLASLRDYEAASIVIAASTFGFVEWALKKVSDSRGSKITGIWKAMSLFLSVYFLAIVGILKSPVGHYVELYRANFQTTDGGANLGISFLGASGLKIVPLAAYSFISNVFGPLPWQIHNAASLVYFFIEVPIIYFVFYSIWTRRNTLPRSALFLLYQALMWFTVFSMTNDNVGTATRLRTQGWILIYIVFAMTLPARLMTRAASLEVSR